jgi:hypothetical protein
MSYAERHTVDVTTNASGAAEVYSPVITGKISAIHYIKPGSGGFENGVGFTITSEITGQSLWTEAAVNASKTVAPRQATHTTAGAAALYASDGAAVLAPIALAKDRVKIAIASGGNTTNGKFIIITE